MKFEVKSWKALTELIKAFPKGEVRSVPTRPPMDLWIFTIKEEDIGAECPHCGAKLYPEDVQSEKHRTPKESLEIKGAMDERVHGTKSGAPQSRLTLEEADKLAARKKKVVKKKPRKRKGKK